MERDPHQLIEGCLIAAYAIGAAQVFLYVRGEMAHAQERIAAALNEAYEANLVGRNILGTDFSVDIVLTWGAGAYIVGEETALIESLEGHRGMPRLKPPYFPAAKGLYMQPTVVNNVETLSNLPWIVNHGVTEYRTIGTESSPGHASDRAVGPCAQSRRVRGSPGDHDLPGPDRVTRLRRRHPRGSRAQDVHSRRRVSALVLPRTPRPASGGPRGRPAGFDARLGRGRRDGRFHRRRAGVPAARCGSSPGSRAASALPVGRERPGRNRFSPASSRVTVVPATSSCSSMWQTTSRPGPIQWHPMRRAGSKRCPSRRARPRSAHWGRRRWHPSPRHCAGSAASSPTRSPRVTRYRWRASVPRAEGVRNG